MSKIPNKTEILEFSFVPLSLTICIIGIIGNVASLVIWKKIHKKTRYNKTITIFFIILVCADIGVLLFSILVMVMPIAWKYLKNQYYYIIFFVYVGHPMHYFCIFFSVYMVMAMSIDRLRLIIYPLSRYRKPSKLSNATILVLFFLSGVLNIPSFFEFEAATEKDGTFFLKEVRYKSNLYFRNVVFLTHCIGVVIIPSFIILISNILIILKSSQRFRKVETITRGHMSLEHRQMTVTVLIVTFIYVILILIQCITRCVSMFYLIDHPSWDQIHFFREIGSIFLPLNSALNFFLFYIPGKKFREELKILLKRFFSRKSENLQQNHKSKHQQNKTTESQTI